MPAHSRADTDFGDRIESIVVDIDAGVRRACAVARARAGRLRHVAGDHARPGAGRPGERAVPGRERPHPVAGAQQGADRQARRRHEAAMSWRATSRSSRPSSDSPLVLGNRVVLLEDGPNTYAAMFSAIAAARDSINMETYILEDDEVGATPRRRAHRQAAARRAGQPDPRRASARSARRRSTSSA